MGHRYQEFLDFLATSNSENPCYPDPHLVAGNYQTHKRPAGNRRLGRHPRFHMHFTPTSAYWL
jgi:hypothetical protein